MRNPTIRKAGVALVAMMASATVASAQTIDFEDFLSRGNFANQYQTCSTTSGPINSSSYHGYTWGTSLYSAQTSASGWGCAVVGQEAVAPAPGLLGGTGYAWNWNGVQSLFIDFLSPTAFTSARFAWLSTNYSANATSMTAYGYDGAGNVVATSGTLTLGGNFATLNANFASVNAVEFRADRSNWFAVDDVVLNATSAPEPSSWMLMATGLMTMVRFGRRRVRRESQA